MRYKIPEWIASHPKYHARVRKTFGKQKLNGHPVRDLLAFKKCCKEAASHVKKELTSYATQHAASLTRSIGTLRELKAGTPLCVVTPHTKSDQALNQAVLQDCKTESKDFPNLRKHIKATLSSSSLANPHTGRTHSFLREAKTSLPAERRHLTHLEHKGKILENSADVAQALKEVWTPIWNNPDPCDDVVEEYLNRYAKKIKSQPCDFTLNMVRRVLLRPRDSATGPDGIPFCVYRYMVDLAAPLLLQYILHLSAGQKPHKSFNFANLFFLPKDDSRLPSAVRPITVVNTDNRLIANVVRMGLTPVLVSILCKTQKAFVPGEDIEGLVRDFNQSFYSSLSGNKTQHQFFHDWKKAYNSVSRKYLLNLLRQVGVLRSYVNIIAMLFVKNKAFPILTDRHKIDIIMRNGLKQGCPLSPILFLLALDPLLTSLRGMPNVHQGAWCDDLALAFKTWDVVPFFLAKIDEYNKATGGRSNTNKSLFISTTDAVIPEGVLPEHWSLAHIVKKYKHLGVWRGPKVTVYDVFGETMQKLMDRVTSFMPYKSSYNMQQRVIISNAFLTSTLTYLGQFFLLGRDDEEEVEKLVAEWVVPGRRLKYDYLCSPTRALGLQQPLQDVYKSNVALVLRGQTNLPLLDEEKAADTDPGSMLISDHTRRAVALYTHLVGSPPPNDIERKSLYSAMTDADETVLYELKRKLQGSTSRRVRDSASAMDLAEIVMANSKLLPADLPARLRNHVFLLVHNALPTQARSRWHPAATAVCKLCGGGTEDLTHLHVTCPTVHTAKSVIITNSPNQGKFLSLRLAEAGDFLMQAVSPVKEDLVKLLSFSLAVWEIRRRVNEANRPPVVAVGRTIAARFQSLYAEITQKKLRKHRDKKKEKQTFLQLWNTFPVQSVRAFTDGSPYGNPGPVGCGVPASQCHELCCRAARDPSGMHQDTRRYGNNATLRKSTCVHLCGQPASHQCC